MKINWYYFTDVYMKKVQFLEGMVINNWLVFAAHIKQKEA